MSQPRTVVLVLGFMAFSAEISLGQDNPEQLSQQVQDIFQKSCYGCHGDPKQKVRGGFDHVLNFDRLRGNPDYLNLQDPPKSGIYKQIENDNMPFGQNAAKLTVDQKKTVLSWIKAGAPSTQKVEAGASQTPSSEAYVLEAVTKDLEAIRPDRRSDIRYLSLTHMPEAGDSAQDMEVFRDALAKLVNSLHWQEEAFPLQAVDSNRSIFRMDLKALGWKKETWEDIGEENPYASPGEDEKNRNIGSQTASKFPIMRGDWFASAASKPKFYHQILELPNTAQELQKLLGFDAAQDVKERRVLRSGFTDSGVSVNKNRILERYRTRYGYYWESKDFKGRTGKADILSRPLGPGEGAVAYEHDGGEIIFSLPNGFQAYMLVNAKGGRIDEAPTNVVQDTSRSNAVIINGLSCISCHKDGMRRKSDQIREHVEKNSTLFDPKDIEPIFATYRGNAKLNEAFDEDEARFLKAQKAAGIKTLKGEIEPVRYLTDRFEADVDLKRAAAELGVSPQTLTEKAKDNPELAALVSRITSKGLPRDVFIDTYRQMLSLLNSKIPNNSGVNANFVFIPAGTFQMGSPARDEDRELDEVQHSVTLSRGFEMQTTEVTQSQWLKVMGNNPSRFNKKENCPKTFDARNSICPNNPVEQVSWNDAQEFIKKLNETARDGYKYRLPTEAEWEWAARGNTQTAYFFGDDPAKLGKFAWFDGNSGGQTHDVTEHARQANAFGLSDMHGNVWEWVEDLYGDYPTTAVTDPKGSSTGSPRVLRGGSWNDYAGIVRSANRYNDEPGFRSFSAGFRLVRSR